MENILSAIGTAYSDDNWIVNCPECEKEFEYTGFFCQDDITKCSWGTSFKTLKIEFEDGSYIEWKSLFI